MAPLRPGGIVIMTVVTDRPAKWGMSPSNTIESSKTPLALYRPLIKSVAIALAHQVVNVVSVEIVARRKEFQTKFNSKCNGMQMTAN
jgi:hypothetical protein